jgi:hypothetical protein
MERLRIAQPKLAIESVGIVPPKHTSPQKILVFLQEANHVTSRIFRIARVLARQHYRSQNSIPDHEPHRELFVADGTETEILRRQAVAYIRTHLENVANQSVVKLHQYR